ncbi:CYTH domain-containing protein [Bacillus suaedaesalsae]|uniref:CYTH domain-containing protein n=1 Tax=Bacillus suaedaesalsae TaxID=2810349 RepID=A0ABS2DIE5_9BACI|nr:CYTH domain-containing protein [Bacillus suaedaesalsae]MBM6618261.1 CYTH domain-containing protein [Bacillus suaedaesalsae]
MNQEIEIEFKNLLSKDEYQTLLTEYSIKRDDIVLQQNHYFDTMSFALKDNGAALRIRYKKMTYTLTLKQPLPEGLLETHQTLTDREAADMLNGGPLVKGDIYKIIKNLNINPSEIRYLGTLETNRVELPYENGILVFDHSSYLNVEDYELEYEAKDYNEGKIQFEKFLTKHDIPTRQTDNKIKRFFNEKKRQLEGS